MRAVTNVKRLKLDVSKLKSEVPKHRSEDIDDADPRIEELEEGCRSCAVRRSK